MSPDGRDGGWSEYAKLVLAELERHNNLLQGIDGKLDAIKLQAQETQIEVKGLKEDVDDHDKYIKDLKKRVYKLEQGEIVDAAIRKYRWWIIAGIFTVTTAIVIPTADIIINLFS